MPAMYDISCQSPSAGSTQSTNPSDKTPSRWAKMSPENHETRSGRRKGSSRSSREVLMNMVAEEIADTWRTELLVSAPSSCSPAEERPQPTKSMSSRDLFYARLNGEELDGSCEDLLHDDLKSEEDIDDDLELQMNGSFAGLAISDVMVSKSGDDDVVSPIKSPSSRRSSRRSKITRKGRRSSMDTATTGVETSSDTLSIQEMQDFVINNMPEEVRDKIPKEAWDTIFGRTSPDNTRKRTVTSQIEYDEEEDTTIVSDITEQTGFPIESAQGPSSLRTLISTWTDWDEDVCPGPAEDENDDVATSMRSESCASETPEHPILPVTRRSSVLSKKSLIPELNKPTLKVSFSHVQVRHYQRILDINPAVTSGPAIGIGWKFRRGGGGGGGGGGKTPVDDWESHRNGMTRSSADLILPREIREQIVTEAGYTHKEIAEALRIVRKARERRRMTIQNVGSGTEAMEETIEAATRRVRGLLSFGKQQGLL